MQIVSRQPSERDATPAGGPAHARMAPLAVLPVFMTLEGRRAIAIGDSDALAWKAELLAAAGAAVEIAAVAPGTELSRLLHEGASAGSLAHVAADWRELDLTGTALVVADMPTEDEARALRKATQTAGVPLNVIDKPAYCDLAFGAIVNRSPVVIGVSTEGAAPILGQAIRRRIEALLPHALQAWGQLAKALRERLNARFADPGRRRAFWEGFVERAFGPPPASGDLAALEAELDRLGTSPTPGGKVTLVGAGPGDAELLTIKAVRALQSAEVILFDDLVADEVLDMARREARRIQVGKRGGRPSCKQEEINELMLKLARAGRHVVRLKSGDPMIFGRAGEEIASLDAAGIPVEIVPGITTGIALAAILGVSLTHRDQARSVRFVTGHSRRGGLPDDLDWRAIADPATTTIFYMATRTADQIALRLAEAGLPQTTPIAVAAALCRPNQQIWDGTLIDLPRIVAEAGTDEPLILGVGKIFAQRHRVAPDLPARAQA